MRRRVLGKGSAYLQNQVVDTDTSSGTGEKEELVEKTQTDKWPYCIVLFSNTSIDLTEHWGTDNRHGRLPIMDKQSMTVGG